MSSLDSVKESISEFEFENIAIEIIQIEMQRVKENKNRNKAYLSCVILNGVAHA